MPLCIAQCMTVGAPQTGKSSLKRRLLKQADGQDMSTGVADKPVVTAVTADGTEWTALEWEDGRSTVCAEDFRTATFQDTSRR